MVITDRRPCLGSQSPRILFLLLKVTVIILEVIYKYLQLPQRLTLYSFGPLHSCTLLLLPLNSLLLARGQSDDELLKKKSLRLKAHEYLHCLLSQCPGMMYHCRNRFLVSSWGVCLPLEQAPFFFLYCYVWFDLDAL